MGDVVPLPVKQAPGATATGAQFLICSCSPVEPCGWVPTVLPDGERFIIISMLCLGCEREIYIENGKPVI